MFILAKPKHPEIIKFFTNTANILRDDVPEHDNITITDPIRKIIEKLDVDGNEALKCIKKTSTATARALIKLKCPNPESSIGLGNVDDSTVQAIIGKFNIVFILVE